MEVSTWMAELRDRARSRGVSLAAMARAAGMRPSNLRRLLSESSGRPRLNTVMRLLPPLRMEAMIGTTRARTAIEVVAALDVVRRRQGATWRSLLGHGRGVAAIVRRLESDHEALGLDVVMRLAGALALEISLVDAGDDAPASPSASSDVAHDHDARRRGRGRRRSRAHEGALDAGADGPPVATPIDAHPRSDEKSPTAGASWPPPPLRPPRLGRYRDMPRERPRTSPQVTTSTLPPPSPPPSPSSSPPPSPRVMPEYTFEHRLLAALAPISENTWRTIVRAIANVVAEVLEVEQDLPDDLVRRVADGTVDFFARLHRPATSTAAPVDPRAADVEAQLAQVLRQRDTFALVIEGLRQQLVDERAARSAIDRELADERAALAELRGRLGELEQQATAHAQAATSATAALEEQAQRHAQALAGLQAENAELQRDLEALRHLEAQVKTIVADQNAIRAPDDSAPAGRSSFARKFRKKAPTR
ncbi:MAG: hypothetical protein IPK80_26215 [Nannocystis sp.]|nr:hypothetical protein [Nannocystis sp.]